MIHVLFFLSGLSALIYQVAWVRLFGRVFGNTIYSASLVVAVFMLGLGVGGLVAGRWADRRYAVAPGSLLRAYGWFEIVIAVMGLIIAALLPRLDEVSALASSYVRDGSGWNVLSAGSYLARRLGRRAAHADHAAHGRHADAAHPPSRSPESRCRQLANRDAYAVNTAGAAAACLLTDFRARARDRAAGHSACGGGVQRVRGRGRLAPLDTGLGIGDSGFEDPQRRRRRAAPPKARAESRVAGPDPGSRVPDPGIALTSLALALSGFAAMGMEILWFRHFSILLGGFRAVFALLSPSS